jgi:uncharacterized protein YjbI with pentapeptide repeats
MRILPLLLCFAVGCNSFDDVAPVSTDSCDTSVVPVSCPGVDLSNAMLDGRNLSNADFTGANFTGASLVGAELTTALFDGADFSGADLTGAEFGGDTETGDDDEWGSFEGTVWRNTVCPDGSLSQNNGATCGGHLHLDEDCDVGETARDLLGEDATCGACDAKPQAKCAFSRNAKRDLRWAVLTGADLTRSQFADTDLTNADLRATNLAGATFRNAHLDGVQWEGAICPDGTQADDNGGTCGGHLTPRPHDGCVAAPGADCGGAFLPNADFRYAQMEGACLQRAAVIVGEMHNTNLVGADMRGIILNRVEFENANLEGVVFGDFDPDAERPDNCQNAGSAQRPQDVVLPLDLVDVSWENTICPDGTNSNENGMTCGGHLYVGTSDICDTKPEAACSNVDLSGADLRSANLQEATMSFANLERANLSDAILEEADLDGANLNGAILTRAFADDVVLSGASINGIQAERASLRDAQFPGATAGVFDTGTEILHANFSGADLSGALFGGARVLEGTFVAALMADSDFNMACLRKANLSGADLSRVRLNRSGLEDALLIDSRINSAEASDLCLRKARLQGLEAHEATLQGSDASGADLTGAILVGADWSAGRFDGANLTQAVLADANFRDSSMVRAMLDGADLSGADFSCTDLTGATVNQRTRVDGLDLRGATGLDGETGFLSRLRAALADKEGFEFDEEVMLGDDPDCARALEPSTCDCECTCQGGPN